MDITEIITRRKLRREFVEEKYYSFRIPGISDHYIIPKCEPSLENLVVFTEDCRTEPVSRETIDEARKYLLNFEPELARSIDLYNPCTKRGIRRVA